MANQVYVEDGDFLEEEFEEFVSRFRIRENDQGLARALQNYFSRCVAVTSTAATEEVVKPARRTRIKK